MVAKMAGSAENPVTEAAARCAGRLHRGLFAAVPLPREAGGRLAVDALEAYITWLGGQRVQGVLLPPAAAGDGLTAADHATVRRLWAAAPPAVIATVAPPADPAWPLETGAAQLRDAARRDTAAAVEAGAAGVLVLPPPLPDDLPDRDGRHLAHVTAVAELDVPVVLGWTRPFAGCGPRPAVLRDLLDLPQVAGVAVATGDLATLQEIVDLVKDDHATRVLVTAEQRLISASLLSGVTGGFLGLAAAQPAALARLFKLWFDGWATDFLQLAPLVDLCAQTVYRWPAAAASQRLLGLLADQGVIPEAAAHDPSQAALGDEDRVWTRFRTGVLRGVR